ncbi:MAG: DNA-formamidopyrimidine glycosylase, partial [Acidobacteria bacterium]|nr:DNA-formamidopyrimidine glycosylase [Acidobacteriota bacterium]
MPELPEVEAVRQRVWREARGAEILAVTLLRPMTAHPQDPLLLQREAAGRTIIDVERRAKNLLLRLSGGVTIRIHLRMTGNLYVVPDVRFRPATVRAWFELKGGAGLLFDDPRALGRMTLHTDAELETLLSELGPEPLSPEFTVEVLAGRAAQSRKPAKLFLMDQTEVAGLGNIYAAEALFRARIHPLRAMRSLRRPKVTALHAAIVDILRDAVQSACTTYAHPGRLLEAEAFQPSVYDREGQACFVCRRT